MEPLLSGAKLSEELDFVKRHADSLGQNKIKYPGSYVGPLENRPKKATIVQVPVCEPPAGLSEEKTPAAENVTLTIKSLKPPLVFTLSAPSTSTIATLKSQLAAQESTCPPPDSQRWILKGKAMGDGKLLKEFAVQDGAVVNLMVKAAAPAVAAPAAADPAPVAAVPSAAATRHTRVPSLTVSGSGPAALSVAIPESAFEPPKPARENMTGESEHFLDTISSPQLWVETLALLKRQFGSTPEGDAQARKVWEAWFSGSREWIEPSEKALIRNKSGCSAMGGV